MKQDNIPGYPGYYISRKGRIWHNKSSGWKELKTHINARDNRVQVIIKLGKHSYCRKVSRLVALAWVPNPRPKEYTVVMHLDNNPLNNHYKNLQWGTQKMDIYQSVVEGRFFKNARYYQNLQKVDESHIKLLIEDYLSNILTIKEILLKYGISSKTTLRRYLLQRGIKLCRDTRFKSKNK